MAKRRYYRTASLLGAQPLGRGRGDGRALPAVRLSWRGALLLALVLAGVLWLWLDGRWYVARTRVIVEGASPQRTAEIIRRADLLGRHSLWLDAAAIAERVGEIPAVRGVQVERQLYPAGCRLIVEEREPLFAWEDDAGRRWWVAEDGILFRPAGERALPVVVGPLPDTAQLPPQVVQGVSALLAQEPKMAALVYNPRYGLVWRDEAGEDVVFGLGDEAAMGQRWALYRRLAQHLRRRGLFPLVIDVRFPEAPAYSLVRPSSRHWNEQYLTRVIGCKPVKL